MEDLAPSAIRRHHRPTDPTRLLRAIEDLEDKRNHGRSSKDVVISKEVLETHAIIDCNLIQHVEAGVHHQNNHH
ncbi:hypothetical protein QN277_009987 [Acacia crassicarpa]|uniref:Uncharacterized protein n=1 Tax=Acacia crassicarpa TaxID=499986 RepID=A0AAE1M604_9FABA|nr:hypothetical protein QN277_009987 [Acacia crassicarpa]